MDGFPDRLTTVDHSPGGLSRRRFLQAALALGGVSAVRPQWILGEAAEAAPLGPADHVLVLVYMGGGNDGLNTVGPFDNGTYRTARGALAIDPAAALPVGDGLFFHPSLPKLKSRFDAGQVAVVRGVGDAADDHSHFSSAATWMAGKASGPTSTGWLGRYLDGAGLGALGAVNIGDGGIPLTLVGQQAPVTGLPTSDGLFGAATGEPHDDLVYNALTAMGQGTFAKGPWAQAVADAVGDGIGVANQLAPAYGGTLPEDDIVRSLLLAARLINLDVGARVITTSFGSFDTHDDQLTEHAGLLGSFDTAVDTFYATLNPTFANRVTIMTFSEFGRRVQANSSRGTDHGTAGLSFVIGNAVHGGLHGAQPSLTALDGRGDLQHTVDFRSLYATVLAGWLGADDAAVIGGTYEHLPLFDSGGPPPPPPPVGGYQPLQPARVLDTRTTGGKVVAGSPRVLTLAGAGGLPATGAGAVILNLTATEPSQATYVTAWPKGVAQPVASNLNVAAGETRPNAVLAKVGADGAISLAVGHGSTHLIADVQGWFPATGSCLTALTPARLLDTRNGTGGPPGKIGAAGTRTLDVTGVGGVPATGVGAVILNLTATEPTASTYLTVYPSGTTRPVASNLNPAAGQTVANLVIATVGSDGNIVIYNHLGSTHVVADVLGWIPSGDARYTALAPSRLLDTRSGLGAPTAKVGAGGNLDLVVAGRGGVPPAGARAAVLNVTVTEPTASTFVTAWPSGTTQPGTSNLNAGAGATVANLVVATLGTNGRVKLANAQGATHLVADVLGWFA